MSIYTKGGDAGKTNLYGGRRVEKSAAGVDVLGQLDELNAFLGSTRLLLRRSDSQKISRIQNDLFVLGSMVAGVKVTVSSKNLFRSQISWMEKEIDVLNGRLPVLKNFILPNGCESSVRLHLARAVCRRCERSLVALGKHTFFIPYINRLSDYLFVLARYENWRHKFKDELLCAHNN